MANKESRKDLLKSPDEFLTFSERAILFVRDHSREFTYAGVAIAALLLIYLGANWYLGYEDRRGQEVYNKAYYTIRSAEASSTAPAASDSPADLFDDLIEEHGFARVSDLALPQLAHLEFQAGNVDEAIELYRSFQAETEAHSSYAAMTRLAIAGCYEAKKDYKAAEEELVPIIDEPGSALKEQALVRLVRLYLLQGRTEKARETQDMLSLQFPASPFLSFTEALFQTSH